MKKWSAFFSLLVLCCSVCYGQIDDIRKLQKQLALIKDSLHYVDALNRLGMLSYENSIDSSFYYTEKARTIADRLQYPRGRADATNNLGVIFDMKGNLQLALRYYNEAYNRYKTIHDSANIVQTIMNIAMVYQELGKDAKAVSSYKKAVALGRQVKQDSIMSLVLYNYVLQYPDSISKDSIPLYIAKSRQIALKYRDERTLLAIEQLTADYYINNNQKDRGIALLQQAVANSIKNKLYYMSLDMLIDLGNIFAVTDSAKSIGYYLQGLQITEQKSYGVYTELISEKLYNFYTSKKDTPQAFYYSRKLLALHEEQEKTNSNSGIDYIEYALKDQQLDAARVQSKYQLWFLSLSVLVCMMTIVIIIILWRNSKQLRRTSGVLRLQFEQSESTMEALDLMNKNYARLIKIVAHDLRNPISAINSIGAMLLPDEALPEETQELIGLVQTSSKSCLELINELLDADFEQHYNLKPERLNPDELLEQCVLLLSFRAKDKNQQLILNSNVQTEITGDREKLWRVLNNLVVNAMKFSPEDSEIRIESHLLADKLLITVKDNGVGIPVELQNKIFDPFTTARRTGTGGEQPFGLGLYISKQIIEAHKGRIWLESEPGNGTTFYVELPVE